MRFRTRPVEEEFAVESSETGAARVDAEAGTGAIKEASATGIAVSRS